MGCISETQYYLGMMFRHGTGVEQSDKKACYWYRLAAEQGEVNAQYNLGWMYDQGKGVNQSYKKACHWYRLAAEQGNPSAQNNLGVMYKLGNGVEQSDTEACHWYRLAAEQGNVSAKNNLSRLKQDHPIAAYHLAMMAKDNKSIKRLIDEAPAALSAGLLWDLNRSENGLLSDVFQSVLLQLLKKKGDGALLVIKCLSSQIRNDCFDFKNTRLLNKLAITNMSQETCIAFTLLLSDLWYYTRERCQTKHAAFTHQAADLLRKTIHSLSSKGLKIEDTAHLRLCALILIKSQYSAAYEVNFTETLTFDQLVAFLRLSRINNITPEKMNSELGLHLIKPLMFTQSKQLLNQLTAYLEIAEVTKHSPTLKALKRKLSTDWQNIIEPTEQKAIQVLNDLCRQAKTALKHSNQCPKVLFAIKEKHAKDLISHLAEGRLHDVLTIISSKQKALSASVIDQKTPSP